MGGGRLGAYGALIGRAASVNPAGLCSPVPLQLRGLAPTAHRPLVQVQP